MKNNAVRTSTGGYATRRSADRLIGRGIAVMQGDVLHMICDDGRTVPAIAPSTGWRPTYSIVPFVKIADSGMSLFPWMSYQDRRPGTGRAVERIAA